MAIGAYAADVYYWTLSDLTMDPGPGTMINPEVDLLIDWDGSVLGLSLARAGDTTLEFYPDGGEPPPPPLLSGLVNGGSSVAPTGYLDPSSNTVVTAGVSSLSYSGSISILRLSPR